MALEAPQNTVVCAISYFSSFLSENDTRVAATAQTTHPLSCMAPLVVIERMYRSMLEAIDN